jgi:hypothetical protein
MVNLIAHPISWKGLFMACLNFTAQNCLAPRL